VTVDRSLLATHEGRDRDRAVELQRSPPPGATGSRTSTAAHSDKWVAMLIALRPAN
jgi:hypothetical protein